MAGCSDWLQSEASPENDQTRGLVWLASLSGKPLRRLFKWCWSWFVSRFTGILRRGEPPYKLCVSICTSPTRLISMRRVIIWLYELIFIEVFFFLSCCKHILKCIYNLYELWLSSILHKQSDKNAFLPLNLFLFGSFWPGSNNVVTVLYCSGDECQIWDSVKLFVPRRLDRCKRTQLCYQKKLAASNSGTANPPTGTQTWTFGSFAISYVSHADNFKIIDHYFFPKEGLWWIIVFWFSFAGPRLWAILALPVMIVSYF